MCSGAVEKNAQMPLNSSLPVSRVHGALHSCARRVSVNKDLTDRFSRCSKFQPNNCQIALHVNDKECTNSVMKK